MKTVFVASPTTRAFEAGYVQSMIQPQGESIEVIWATLQNQPIDFGRNHLAKAFLNHPKCPEFLLFADSDATWPAGAIERLVSRNQPMVCGTFYLRSIPPAPPMGPRASKDLNNNPTVSFGWTVEKILAYCEKYGLNHESAKSEWLYPIRPDDLVEVDGCGMHFTMIRRDAFIGLKEPYFKFTSPAAGEDFYFCSKAREAGVKIFLDLSVHVGHLAGPNFVIGTREFLFYRNSIKSEEEIWRF